MREEKFCANEKLKGLERRELADVFPT